MEAVLLFQSLDRPGIVASISSFVWKSSGNIMALDQYTTNPEGGHFFLRMEVAFSSLESIEQLEKVFSLHVKEYQADWKWALKSYRPKVGILVSKQGHCLWNLLYHWLSNDLNIDISFVASNHFDCEKIVQSYGIPYYYLPVTKEDKQEDEILSLSRSVDCLILARYMQILSKKILEDYGRPVINIHHSFLPSFVGANPYAQAYERGVKLIGATAHYVTEHLDQGPIIEQVVERVSHKDSAEQLKTKGKNLEQLALLRAVRLHAQHKVMIYGNRTIVFD